MNKKFKKRFKIKGLAVMMLAFICLLTANITPVSAATLTAAQKQTLYDSGFPTSRSAYIDAFYTDWVNNVDYSDYGSFDQFGSFVIFVTNLALATSPDGLEDFSIVARGLYSEVSGHTGYYQTELQHISDSLINRVQSGLSKWPTYKAAAQVEGMNAINPSYTSGHWKGTPVRDPLYDSAWLQEARIGLITAYCMAWDGVGVNRAPSYQRYSDLETYRYYFNEDYVAGRHQAGHFYFY